MKMSVEGILPIDKDEIEFTPYQDWDCDECEYCERLAFHSVHLKDGDVAEKWLCAGKIILKEEPKDIHQALNKIRFCIADFRKENESKQYEWTPYEASSVSLVLNHAVTSILQDFHLEEYEKAKLHYEDARTSDT